MRDLELTDDEILGKAFGAALAYTTPGQRLDAINMVRKVLGATKPHPADGDEQVTRLIHAVEGECHGLAITKDQAVAILSYVCPPDTAVQSPAEGDEHPAEQVCAQAYQVVGSLLSDLDQFGTELADKILDNLSEARIVHDDVLPWPSFANVQPKGSDKANEWRKLAQQFDGQRMAAMVHLRTLLAMPQAHAEAARAFLAATPAEQIASVAPVQAPAPAHDETAWLLETSGGGHALYWDGGLWIGEHPRVGNHMQFGLTTTKDASKAVRFMSRELVEAALKSFRADWRVAIGGAGVWKAAEHMWPAVQAPAVGAAPAPATTQTFHWPHLNAVQKGLDMANAAHSARPGDPT